MRIEVGKKYSCSRESVKYITIEAYTPEENYAYKGTLYYIDGDMDSDEAWTEDGRYALHCLTNLDLCEELNEEPEKATRHNAGKIDFTLIPVDAEEEEAKVWMKGEEKYGRDNWQKLWGDDTLEVVLASLLRHVKALQRGEWIDEDTGCQHAGNIRCNAAMLIRYFNENKDTLMVDKP